MFSIFGFVFDELMDSCKTLVLYCYAICFKKLSTVRRIIKLTDEIKVRAWNYFPEKHPHLFPASATFGQKYLRRSNLLDDLWLKTSKKYLVTQKRRNETHAEDSLNRVVTGTNYPPEELLRDDPKAKEHKEFLDFWDQHNITYVERDGILSLHETDHFERTLLLNEFTRYGNNDGFLKRFLRHNMRNRHLIDIEAICNDVYEEMKQK